MVPRPVLVRIPDPSIDRDPKTLTVTLPALPVLAGAPFKGFGPNAILEIAPVLRKDNVPALTATIPAFPLLPGSASDKTPVASAVDPPAPSIISWPSTVTETLPPF